MNKTSPRVREKRRQARRQILEAAQRILSEEGADAVTLASVAGALGMTKQALYHYFSSKEALVRSLVSSLIDDEIDVLIAALDEADRGKRPLGVLIRTFYEHYRGNLDAFRTVYCHSQMYSSTSAVVDKETLRGEINPGTRKLFDRLEDRLAGKSMSKPKRQRLRRLAFTAWTSALGLVTMLGVADAINDPLVHSDEDLLDTLIAVFDKAATPG